MQHVYSIEKRSITKKLIAYLFFFSFFSARFSFRLLVGAFFVSFLASMLFAIALVFWLEND